MVLTSNCSYDMFSTFCVYVLLQSKVVDAVAQNFHWFGKVLLT
jgi:hypothetical protein